MTLDDRTAGTDAETAGDEGGFVLTWFAVLLLVLMAMAGFAVDVWNWWYTAQQNQRAADAGALAGVVFLPSDPGQATATAQATLARNDVSPSDATIAQGTQHNQLEVTVNRTVNNTFVSLLGIDQTTITRKAVAEYQGPVPMGSPVNQLANDPFGGDQNDPTVAPRFWLNEAAPNATTQSGDRHQAGNCSRAADNCVGGVNEDYDEDGYVFAVDVRSTASGLPLQIQVYDAGFYFVNDTCGANLFDPANVTHQGYIADLQTNFGIADANVRYVEGNNRYCAGDQDISGRNIDTTYIVRGPDSTPFNDFDNPVVCIETFRARNGNADDLYNMLRDNNPTTPEGRLFRDYFRQWTEICSVTTPAVGQYLVQVRSNADLSNMTGNPSTDSRLQFDSGVNTGGHNRYSLRAGFGAAGSTPSGTDVGLFANGRLPIYVNQNDGSSNTEFFLARLEPLNANRTLELNFFDIGDVSSGSVTLTIVPPSDATVGGGTPLSTFSNCEFTPRNEPTETLPTCSRPGMTSADFQGEIVQVRIPIDPTYDCNEADFVNGCWVKVRMGFTGGARPNDTTTWSANIIGDPVRLVE